MNDTKPTQLSASDSLMWRIESDPILRSPILVVGVEHAAPTLAVCRPLGHPGVLVPPAVEVLVVPVRPRHPDHLRHRVGQLPEPGLAFMQRLLGLAACLDLLSSPVEQAGILDGDAGMGGNAVHQLLQPCGEAAGVRIGEEQAAIHVAGP